MRNVVDGEGAWIALVCLVGLLVAAGCQSAPEEQSESLTVIEDEVAGPQLLDVEAVFAEVAPMLPEDTLLVTVVDVERLIAAPLLGGAGMMPDDWDSQPMLAQLSAFSKERLGLDLTTIQRGVFSFSMRGPVLLIDGQAGPLPATSQHLQAIDGAEGAYRITESDLAVYAFPSGWRAVGPSEAVDALAAVKLGQARALPQSDSFKELTKIMAEAGPGLLAGAAQLGRDPYSQMLALQMPTGAPDQLGFVLTANELKLIARGGPMAMTGLSMVALNMIEQVKRSTQAKLAQLDSLSTFEGIGVILGAHLVQGLEKPMSPVVKGKTMTMTFPLPDGFVASLPTISMVSAAIAVPAFAKYVNKSKASEARLNVKALADGSQVFYFAERVDRSGKPLPPRFPASASSHATRGCCGGGGNRCGDGPAVWDKPGFVEAKFAIVEPHHYTYEIISNGKSGQDAEATLKAWGDLDCDGVFSEFSVRVWVNDAGEPVADPKLVVNELE